MKNNVTVKASVAGSVYLTGAWAVTISGNGNLLEGVQFVGGSCYPLVSTLQKCDQSFSDDQWQLEYAFVRKLQCGVRAEVCLCHRRLPVQHDQSL